MSSKICSCKREGGKEGIGLFSGFMDNSELTTFSTPRKKGQKAMNKEQKSKDQRPKSKNQRPKTKVPKSKKQKAKTNSKSAT